MFKQKEGTFWEVVFLFFTFPGQISLSNYTNNIFVFQIFFGKIAARILPQLCVLKLDTKNVSRDQAVVN